MKLKGKTAKLAIAALSTVMAVSWGSFSGFVPRAAAATSTEITAGVAQEYESLFQAGQIMEVKVTIADEDWTSILASPLDKEYKKVTAEVNGSVLENVGFSTKGNLTLNSVAGMSDSDRYSFRLKFDKYDKKQTLLGLDKLVLNNNYSDPSFMREYLHYEALRSIGLNAPLVTFANLYINGELYGFYTAVEAVDDSYMERNFGEDMLEEGTLYDTEAGTTLQYSEDSDYGTISLDAGKDDDKASLKNFIKVLNEMPAGEKGDIEQVLDVDSALKYIAANVVFGNYDSYNGDKAQNFELFGDKDGKFTVIPWDFNMSFNGYTGGQGMSPGATGTSSNSNATNVSLDAPVLGVSMTQRPLINNLLQVAEYKEKYLSYVSELVDYMSDIEQKITGLADFIRPCVEADPTKFYTMEQFESNVSYSIDSGMNGGFGGTPPQGTMTERPQGAVTTPPQDSDSADANPPSLPDGTAPQRPADGAALPEGSENANALTPPTDGGAQFGGRGGNSLMASGSIMTFALNRLVNLQEQLGLPVTKLPEAAASTATDSADPAVTENTAANAGGIQVSINGKFMLFPDQQPVLQNGSVLLPVSELVNVLGGTASWDKDKGTVTIENGSTKITWIVGSNKAYVNGSAVTLSTPASILSGRTMVPVRFLSERLGLTVKWVDSTKTVLVTSEASDEAYK